MPDNNFAKVWTKDRCVEALRAFGSNYGYMSAVEYQKQVTFLCSGMKRGTRPFPNIELIREHFKSVDDAWRAAGIAVPEAEPVSPGQKRCPRCGPQDVEKFGKNKAAKSGLQTYCKTCQAALSKKHAAKKKQRQLTTESEKLEAVNATLDGAAGVKGVTFKALDLPRPLTSIDLAAQLSSRDLEVKELKQRCELLASVVSRLVRGDLPEEELRGLRAGLAVAGTLGG